MRTLGTEEMSSLSKVTQQLAQGKLLTSGLGAGGVESREVGPGCSQILYERQKEFNLDRKMGWGNTVPLSSRGGESSVEIELFYPDTFGNYAKVSCLSLPTCNMSMIISFVSRNSALEMRGKGKMQLLLSAINSFSPSLPLLLS